MANFVKIKIKHFENEREILINTDCIRFIEANYDKEKRITFVHGLHNDTLRMTDAQFKFLEKALNIEIPVN